MKLVNTKQTWQGIFTHEEGYSDIEQYYEIPFTMEIEINEGSFIGTSTDEESKDLFDQPAKVTGFFEDDMVSFVLKYPHSYYRDDQGNICTEEEYEHPDIQYLGFYDEDLKCYAGNWEMVVDQVAFGSSFLEEVANGSFEMRRIE